MFASLTVLPAMLSWLGDRVEKGRVPLLGRRRRPAGQSRFWAALTGRVMRRPALSIVLAGGLLVALAIPALQMKIVTSGIDQLPQDLPIIETYDKVKAVFPTRGRHGDRGRRGRRRALAAPSPPASPALRAQVDALRGVPARHRGHLQQGRHGRPDRRPDAGQRQRRRRPSHALNVLRDQIIPATSAGSTGATVNVTGDAASSKDFADQLKSRLPLIFAFVFGLAFLLMLVTFRSIVIPIKAILLNLLSVGAAYGVLVLVFQDGHGESLLGFTSIGGVTNWLPLFLFVVLFGLSMDYHVFILSRVRELHERGMTHRRGRQAGHLDHRRDGHERRRRHGRRVRGLHHPELPRLQGAGARAGRGRPDRRDDHPRRAAARLDEAPRRLELVPAPAGWSGCPASAPSATPPVPRARRPTSRKPTSPARPCRSDGSGIAASSGRRWPTTVAPGTGRVPDEHVRRSRSVRAPYVGPPAPRERDDRAHDPTSLLVPAVKALP